MLLFQLPVSKLDTIISLSVSKFDIIQLSIVKLGAIILAVSKQTKVLECNLLANKTDIITSALSKIPLLQLSVSMCSTTMSTETFSLSKYKHGKLFLHQW